MDLRKIYSAGRIAREVERLAEQINADYAGQELRLLVVLRGAFIFAADLVRLLHVPLHIHFISIASYSGTETTGNVIFNGDLEHGSIAGHNVLVVEDIVDTGLTLSALLEKVREKEPKSLRVCTFIDKTTRRLSGGPPHYVGIRSNGGFLVGYGLDLNGNMRELPDIYEISAPGSGGLDDSPV